MRRLRAALLASIIGVVCAPSMGVAQSVDVWLGGGVTINTHDTMRRGVHVYATVSRDLGGIWSARLDGVAGTANSAVADSRGYFGSVGASLVIKAGGDGLVPYGFFGLSLNRHSEWDDASGLSHALGTEFGVGGTATVGTQRVFAEISGRAFGNIFGSSGDTKSFAPVSIGIIF